MSLFDTDDGLSVRQEGRNARASVGSRSYLFVESDRDMVIAAYLRFVCEAREYLGRRWHSFNGSNVDAHDFSDLTQEATLHWMYIYIINRKPVQITDADWDHPHTYQIIQSAVERRFPPGSREATDLCAHLMGLSQDGYLNWRAGNELFLNK